MKHAMEKRADSQVAELCEVLQLAERLCWDEIDTALYFNGKR